jgi:multicomponent Na+:H+ antiporter subunit A
MNGGALLVIALAVPLTMLSACLARPARDRMPVLLALAPLPALAAACLGDAGSTAVLPQALLSLTLVLDRPGGMLLGVASLLWIAAGAYASSYLRGNPNGGRFAVWWLMTLTGNVGAFIAGDLAAFYLFFTLASLAAYGLVVFDDTASARRAAAIYVALAVLGEALLLMAFVLLAAAAPNGSLAIRDAVASLPASQWRDYALAFLMLAFGLKIGLVPIHVWMPLTYSAAPIPAAAVLSGSAVKVGVIGLIRFLPFESAMPGWGEVLATAGLISVYYGVAVGITQTNLKTVLAYSSVSQMGLLATVLGMGLAAGDKSAAMVAAFSAAFHVLVKGGLFLAVGVASAARHGLRLVLLPAAVLALGLGGLPFTGGALAKLAAKPVLGDGVAGTLATLAAVGSTILMLHFLHLFWTTSHEADGNAFRARVLPWLVIAFTAIVLPWVMFPDIAKASLRDVFAPKEIWAALWPVLFGASLSLALLRWNYLLPRVPEGDVLVAYERSMPVVRECGAGMERLDAYLRQWPVAGVLLLALAIILSMATLTGR